QYVCFHFTMNGSEYADDLGESMPFEEFYGKIAAGALPTTSQVNVDQFLEFFEPFLADGKDIIHVSLSSGLSGSLNSAGIARAELLEKYPEREILVVDSLGASSGYGMLVDALANLRDGGASMEELRDFAAAHRLSIHHWFFSTDLSHYRRGGRISGMSAAIGTALCICPLMNMDNLGHLIAREKIRGKKNVIDAMVKKMIEHADGGINYSGKCFISHSNCFDNARTVAELVEKTFKKLDGKVLINSVGTVIGSHTGPGTVALFFFGDKREN
ncbi:MAG: DegV family protein, partial [Oscillospiraceae bacterium]